MPAITKMLLYRAALQVTRVSSRDFPYPFMDELTDSFVEEVDEWTAQEPLPPEAEPTIHDWLNSDREARCTNIRSNSVVRATVKTNTLLICVMFVELLWFCLGFLSGAKNNPP